MPIEGASVGDISSGVFKQEALREPSVSDGQPPVDGSMSAIYVGGGVHQARENVNRTEVLDRYVGG